MKPFVRPPLVITTEPTKHNFYVTFNPDTGKVTGMTPQKQGNCVEIDEYLANQIHYMQDIAPKNITPIFWD